MRIGIDFDNTIANYDGVFLAAARERGLVLADIGSSKNAVRDHLNGSGQKDAFTELQGYVYGARMDLVSPYAGVRDFIMSARAEGHELAIVSHKTRTPMRGPAYDMHEAARGFLAANRFVGDAVIDAGNVYFELTKEDKMARATKLGCDVFIDDLPEILTMSGLPADLRRILFDPDGHHAGSDWSSRGIERHNSWVSITRAILGRAT